MSELEPRHEQVRKATESDTPRLYQLILMGVAEGHLLHRSLEELQRLVNNFYVWDEGKVVGCASLDKYTTRIAEVRSVYVLPEFRHRKIASQLIRACLEEADTTGIKELLTVTDAVGLFEAQGFSNNINGQQVLFRRT